MSFNVEMQKDQTAGQAIECLVAKYLTGGACLLVLRLLEQLN